VAMAYDFLAKSEQAKNCKPEHVL